MIFKISKWGHNGDNRDMTGVVTGQATEQVSEAKKGATEQVTEQVTEQTLKLLKTLGKRTMALQELMGEMDLKHRPSFLYTYIQPSLEDGYIEMTRPETPKSRLQKYRLTKKGIKTLDSIKVEE